MLLLNAKEVRQALPMGQAIQNVKRAFAALSEKRAEVPLRQSLPIANQNALCLFMPGFVEPIDAEPSLGVKIVSVFPNNPQKQLPLIHASVLVLDPSTGRILCMMEGASLTAIRTGAASGAATDLLSRKDSHTVAIFGAGVQGRTQLEAVCTVREIKTVWIYDPDLEKVTTFIQEMAGKNLVPNDLRAAETPTQAVEEADIICTATTSSHPVFNDEDIPPGTHINGVGSYTPNMCEIPPETVTHAYVVVDSYSAALKEAGDIIQPLENHLISESHIAAELGEIVLGKKPARKEEKQITFFKSVGNAVQDVICSQVAYRNALELQIGQKLEW